MGSYRLMALFIVAKATDLLSAKTKISLRPATTKIHLVTVVTLQRISRRLDSCNKLRNINRLLMFEEFIISTLEKSIITSQAAFLLTVLLTAFSSSAIFEVPGGISTRMISSDRF